MRFPPLFVGALLLGLTACYSPATMNIKLDGIRTIAITEIEEPVYFNIIAVSHRLPKRDIQGYFGFGGAFISVSAERAMFSQLMASQNFRVGNELQAAIVQAMQRNGYEIATVKIPHPRKDTVARLEELPPINADALLDVIFWNTPGYEDAFFGDFTPHLGIQVQLIDIRNRKILYSDRILYGEGAAGVHQVKADSRFTFKSYEAMESDPRTTVEGLRTGIPILANTVGMALTNGSGRSIPQSPMQR